MGQFASGLVQGAAQGMQQRQAREFQKQQLDLEKKRFDLEEKQGNLQMQILQHKLSTANGLQDLIGSIVGGDQSTQAPAPAPMPSMPMPSTQLDASPLTLRDRLSSAGPQLPAELTTTLPQDGMAMAQAAPAPAPAPSSASATPEQQATLKKLLVLNAAQENWGGVQGILERMGKIPRAPKEETPENQFIADYLKKNPGAIGGAITAYKKLGADEGGKDKAPLPTTEQGYTVQFNPGKGINEAVKQMPDGTIVREPYNPQKHGLAVAASGSPIQRELEAGILSDAEAKNYAKGVAEGRIAPRQINEVAGGFGQVANINRGKIVKAMAREFPKFGWKNADILFKYQENPQVFMGMVNINAVRPRIEAMRQKFSGLKNLDFLPANAAKNAIAKQFGDQALVDFESNRTQVVFELQRALTGIGQMSDSRIAQEMNNLSTAYSPGQMNKAIDNINEVLDAKFSALQAGPFASPALPPSIPLDEYLNKMKGK